jgi:hypothetical protein
MASSTYVIGTLSEKMVFGTGDADVVSSETKDAYQNSQQAVDGNGKVLAVLYSAPIRTISEERYGTVTSNAIGADGVTSVSMKRSNQDFARISTEKTVLIGE